MKNIEYLDKEEKELAQSIENEEWVSDLSKNAKKKYEQYAKYSLEKKQKKLCKFKENHTVNQLTINHI